MISSLAFSSYEQSSKLRNTNDKSMTESKSLRQRGFTLIEVLLALAVIAIALTALISVTAKTVMNTQRIKEKAVSHWVAVQGVRMIQLGLISIPANQTITKVTKMLGQRWYWQASLEPTGIKDMQQINLSLSKYPMGPFHDKLVAFMRTSS